MNVTEESSKLPIRVIFLCLPLLCACPHWSNNASNHAWNGAEVMVDHKYYNCSYIIDIHGANVIAYEETIQLGHLLCIFAIVLYIAEYGL